MTDLTDTQIESLLAKEKVVLNPRARKKQEGKHFRQDFNVESADGNDSFKLYIRQSTVITKGFSAILVWISSTKEETILMRCNGADHPHTNKIEGNKIDCEFHIHTATERYITKGMRAESFAIATTEYTDIEGAKNHLCTLCNIKGFENKNKDERTPDLFK